MVFIGHGDEENFVSCGTAFLLHYDTSLYLVSARHVAQDLGDDPFSIRINKTDGASDTWHHDPLDNRHEWFRWYFPSDPAVDIAIIPFNFAFYLHGCDLKALRGEEWIMDDVLKAEEQIGPGDICHAIGLFKLVQGMRRNVPIVHTGRIAMNAGEELVPVEDWNNRSKTINVRGHLVELTNLEGLSGAPVFVRGELRLGQIPFPMGEREVSLTDARLHLLGVWQGSWNYAIHDGRRPLAIGVVVPASDLLALLEQQDVVEARDVHKERMALMQAAKLEELERD